MRTVGNARHSEIEVRYALTTRVRDVVREELDEIVAFGAYVHLEKMDDGEFALIVETAKEMACFYILSTNGRAHVHAMESWRDQKSASDPPGPPAPEGR